MDTSHRIQKTARSTQLTAAGAGKSSRVIEASFAAGDGPPAARADGKPSRQPD